MSEPATEYRFYGELAEWWPLISPPDEYAEEATFLAEVLTSAARVVRDVLELGSGGGSNASHLKFRFALTLVDLSAQMLDISRRLNPECEHLQGDLRHARLGRDFDAVLVHDAIDYMTYLDDLRQAVRTAFVHCRPGGVAVFLPDDTVETFGESTDCGGQDAPTPINAVAAAGTRTTVARGVRYLEWSWDPDPADSWVLTEYAFLLRRADGSTQVVHETHRLGLFSRATWIEVLEGAGFTAEVVPEDTTEDRAPRSAFVGRRSASSAARTSSPAISPSASAAPSSSTLPPTPSRTGPRRRHL